MLHDEFQYFIDHQDELVRQYEGRFVVIKGGQVIGDYASALIALLETRKSHAEGTFLIQKCAPGPEAYTVTISTLALKFAS